MEKKKLSIELPKGGMSDLHYNSTPWAVAF